LSYAYLGGADISAAGLSGADLRYAFLGGAGLDAAELSGANLTMTSELTQRQVSSACSDPENPPGLPSGLESPPACAE
jgi:uncharacterized protein YjbI with pentapeptide repeats